MKINICKNGICYILQPIEKYSHKTPCEKNRDRNLKKIVYTVFFCVVVRIAMPQKIDSILNGGREVCSSSWYIFLQKIDFQ